MLQRKLWTEEGETKEPGEFVLAGRIQFLCGGKITELKLETAFNLIIKRKTRLLSQVCEQCCNLKKKEANIGFRKITGS